MTVSRKLSVKSTKTVGAIAQNASPEAKTMGALVQNESREAKTMAAIAQNEAPEAIWTKLAWKRVSRSHLSFLSKNTKISNNTKKIPKFFDIVSFLRQSFKKKRSKKIKFLEIFSFFRQSFEKMNKKI